MKTYLVFFRTTDGYTRELNIQADKFSEDDGHLYLVKDVKGTDDIEPVACFSPGWIVVRQSDEGNQDKTPDVYAGGRE